MPYDEFSYQSFRENLKTLADVIPEDPISAKNISGYQANISPATANCGEMSEFVSLSYIKADSKHFRERNGWKLHISLDEEPPTNLEKGWNIIKDFIIKHRIVSSKVLRPGKSLADDKTQRGKQVTIYMFHNPELNAIDWQNLITEITQEFVAQGIKPGYSCDGSANKPENRINGSNFFYYRNDASKTPKNNPYKNIIIDVYGQLEIKSIITNTMHK